MLGATSSHTDPIKHLENTLAKHTSMFDTILQAIQDSETAMEAHLGDIQVETGLMHADHAKLEEQVDEAESLLASLTPSMKNVLEQLRALQEEVPVLRV
ncbi:hypothetical protein NDU88_006471 [Pleurodeles waltl]|uniref:Uncharacterized protein n=1 Tax=Pleurodeles waltl TaxID=8319 RepID=A0AAV7MHJ1_PLEWA|nr:hypothetical protein NDU88_006471 [Pleurodeles waltl]